MRYRLLGKSGLRVSELCLGGMTFGEQWQNLGMATSREEARAIFDAFAVAGGNFVDTANFYNSGNSEQFIGEFVGSERERFVLGTKYTLTMQPSDPNGGGNHRKNLMQSLHASLKRLKTDYVDLYWLHVWDYTTPIEEVMRALDDAVRSGKILYVGISDSPAWVVSKANTLAEMRGWTPFIGLQIQYSLVERSIERELLPMARELGLGITAWSPLGMGLLTGKYNGTKDQGRSETGRLEAPAMTTHPLKGDKTLAIAKQVQELAAEFGRKPSQVALSWVRQKGIIPIIGARRVSQVKENLDSVDLELSHEQIERLDDLSKIEMGFPHDLMEAARSIIFGTALERIETRQEARGPQRMRA